MIRSIRRPTETTFIVAEAGVNHNGDRDIAFQMVEAAAGAGVDAVKFQTFNTASHVTRVAPKAAYQSETTDPKESQFEMLRKLEIDHDTHRALKQYAEKKDLQFISTAFDFESLAFLSNDLQLEILKIPSGEVTNGPLLLEFAKTDRQLIMSTGMANMDEIRQALTVLAYGMTEGRYPSKSAFTEAYESEEGQTALRDRVMLLHCTTQYPAPFESINLRAMASLRDTFCLRVGYSDHSKGILVPCTAVALGAVSIEKHFTLDRMSLGPDHSASLEPEELREMVEAIRSTETILGDGEKVPHQAEVINREVARKSLVAATAIAKGESFSRENLAIKRPGGGRSPMDYWSLIGSRSPKDYCVDDFI